MIPPLAIRRRSPIMCSAHTITIALLPLLLLLALTAPPTLVTATITISESGRQIPSRPAAFGMEFEYGLQYVAKIQFVKDDLHLCHGITDMENDFDEDEDLDAPAALGNNSSYGGETMANVSYSLRKTLSTWSLWIYHALLSRGDSSNNSMDDEIVQLPLFLNNHDPSNSNNSNSNNDKGDIEIVPSNGVPGEFVDAVSRYYYSMMQILFCWIEICLGSIWGDCFFLCHLMHDGDAFCSMIFYFPHCHFCSHSSSLFYCVLATQIITPPPSHALAHSTLKTKQWYS